MQEKKLTAAQEWKAGWLLVLVSSVGFSFFSIMLAGTSLFIEPLTREFNWSRTLLSLGPTIATVVTALLSPFVGMLMDRWGARKLALPGLILTMASISAFSLLNGTPIQWMLLWFIFGLVAVSIKSTAWTSAVLGLFKESRGLALGMTLAGTAVAGAVMPPLTNWLIFSFGWRMAYIWLALGWGGVTFILCWLFFFDKNDDTRRAARAARAAGRVAASSDGPELEGLTTKQASRDSAMWRVGISNFVVMLLTQGLAFHLFPILTEAGVSRTQAAWLVSLGGIAGIVGKLVTGVLLDRFRPNWIGGVTLGVTALAFLLLMVGIHSPALVVTALLVNGYAAGTKTQITGFLTASYGGMRNFGAIYGVMAALMALASGTGPLIAGVIYDNLGGYDPFLIAGSIGCALGGVLMITLPAYPRWQKKEDKTEAAEAQVGTTIN